MFHIDARDPLPIYAQLERAIKVAIATGAMQPGERLPTVRELAVDLKINANTIAKVYAELERQGVVATKRGVGTFAQSPAAASLPRAQRAHTLHAMVERLLAEATAHGITIDELIEQLRRFPFKPKEKPRVKR